MIIIIIIIIVVIVVVTISSPKMPAETPTLSDSTLGGRGKQMYPLLLGVFGLRALGCLGS